MKRCDRCGALNSEDTEICKECGTIFGAPPALPQENEGEKKENGSEPIAMTHEAAPPVVGPALPPTREKTPVRSLNLAELLFLASGLFLLSSGFQNLGAGISILAVQFVLLGIVATLFGLLQIAFIVMPDMMASLEKMRSTMTVVIALTFLIWGTAAAFGPSVGVSGGFIASADLASTLGIMLNEGMIR